METVQVGNNRFTVEYPLLHKKYNPIYSITTNKIYYCCPKTCNICKEWNQRNQIWKTLCFFPKHCHLCMFAGENEDFEKENIFIVCKKCHNLIKKRKRELFNYK